MNWKIKTEYNRRDYYFDRQDNTPWIPIAEEEERSIFEEIVLWILVVLLIVLCAGIWVLV